MVSSLSHLAPSTKAPSSRSHVAHRRATEKESEKDRLDGEANNSRQPTKFETSSAPCPHQFFLAPPHFCYSPQFLGFSSLSLSLSLLWLSSSPSLLKGRRILWDAECFPSLFIVSLIRFFSLFNERTIRSSSSSSSSVPSFPLNPRLYSCFFFCVLPLFGWSTKERRRRAESRMAQESLCVRILNVVLTHETLSDEIFRNSKIQTPSCSFRCNFRG